MLLNKDAFENALKADMDQLAVNNVQVVSNPNQKKDMFGPQTDL